MKPRILILTPFRNEDHAIPLYLDSLREVEYPKELIDVFWLENDSTDKTLRMLQAIQPKMPFRKTTLKPINILGPIEKAPPGKYWKDMSYGSKRVTPWLIMWNEYFLSTIRKSDAKYILFWFADIMVQSDVITEFLKVFDLKPDAGWVGGAMHRKCPRQDELSSPWFFGRPNPAHKDALNIIPPLVITEVKTSAHCWMMPRKVFIDDLVLSHPWGWDWSMGITEQLRERGYKVYYQPSVYIKHISTDSKIYMHGLEG